MKQVRAKRADARQLGRTVERMQQPGKKKFEDKLRCAGHAGSGVSETVAMFVSPPVAGVDRMDFIERLFGWSPDGGDGTFELLLFAIPLAGIIYLVWRRRRARQQQSRHERD